MIAGEKIIRCYIPTASEQAFCQIFYDACPLILFRPAVHGPTQIYLHIAGVAGCAVTQHPDLQTITRRLCRHVNTEWAVSTEWQQRFINTHVGRWTIQPLALRHELIEHVARIAASLSFLRRSGRVDLSSNRASTKNTRNLSKGIVARKTGHPWSSNHSWFRLSRREHITPARISRPTAALMSSNSKSSRWWPGTL